MAEEIPDCNAEPQPHGDNGREAPVIHPPVQEPTVEEILDGNAEPQPHGDNDQEAEATANKKRDDFIKKHQLKDKIHADSSLSKLDVLMMILHLSVRHCNTQHFVEDLIKFVNCLCGESALDISFYIYKTLFKPCVDIIKHFFCTECELYLGREEDFFKPQCPQCNFISDSSSKDIVVCADCNCYVGTLKDFDGSESMKCPQCMKDISCLSTAPESSAVCSNCKYYMVSRKDFLKRLRTCECEKCHKQVDAKSVNSGNYFITFSVREQIQEFLSRPGLKFVDRTNRDSSVIADICDGAFYRKLMEPGGPLSNEFALTMTFNTDGVEVHKSTKNSLWPIWFHINEIIPEQRFKQENLILAGLWFGKSAPNMSIFLQPFANELVELSADGVTRILHDGSPVKCPVYPLTCSLDSVAKPKVVCQKQFNGKWGCLYCYHPNDTTAANVRNQRFYDQETTYNLRTEEEVIRDMCEADSLQRQGLLKSESVNGFLGISVLTFTDLLDFLPSNTFSVVFGVVIDYLHAVLEGVSADLFNIISNLLTPEQLEILNRRNENITPPQAMTRRPRSFKHMTYWKAKEYRAVLLYYILPCVEGLLAEKYYENLKLFVNALHVLLSDSITSVQLSEAASCLNRFCIGFQRLYGIVNVSYNLHLCRHLAELAKRYGALWCYSNFIFESGNGYLLNLVRGTKSVINEIAVKHTAIQTAFQFIMRDYISAEAIEFCSLILKCKYPRRNEGLEKAPLALSISSGELSEDESLMLSERNVALLDNNSVLYYSRVIRNGIVYNSKSYKKAKVHDDSCVMLREGGFAVIDKIVPSASNELLCLVKPIRIAQGSDIIPSIKRCYDVFENSKVIPFSDVLRKCFFVTVEGRSFVCQIPNFYERD